MVKLSVIIPVYCAEKYIRKCLDSVLAQTMRDIEIIVIDDGSPDASGKIADEYAAADIRIRVIHTENCGVGAARNTGLKTASGEYVGFVDPDDWIDSDFYEKLYAAATTAHADIAKAGVIRHIAETGEQMEISGFKNIRKNRVNFQDGFWAAIYRREFLNKNNIDFPADCITGQDIVFLMRAVLAANAVELVPGTYYHYFYHAGSLDSETLSDAKIKSKIRSTNLIIDAINKSDLDMKSYRLVFDARMRYLLFKVFYRTKSDEMRRAISDAALDCYKNCKFPHDVLDEKMRRLLRCGNAETLTAYLIKNPYYTPRKRLGLWISHMIKRTYLKIKLKFQKHRKKI